MTEKNPKNCSKAAWRQGHQAGGDFDSLPLKPGRMAVEPTALQDLGFGVLGLGFRVALQGLKL